MRADLDEESKTKLQIYENLRRRSVSPVETAKAIKRLYEMLGIDRKGGRPEKNLPANGRFSEVEKETGLAPDTPDNLTS